MEEQQSIDIIKNLLKAKNNMEKGNNFAIDMLNKAKQRNPVNNYKVLQLHQNILNLKRATGAAKINAASELAKTLVGNAKPVFCNKCGSKITSGKKFCANCGYKII